MTNEDMPVTAKVCKEAQKGIAVKFSAMTWIIGALAVPIILAILFTATDRGKLEKYAEKTDRLEHVYEKIENIERSQTAMDKRLYRIEILLEEMNRDGK